MLCRLPSYVPPLSTLLADIGSPSPAQLAKALHVSRRTVARWIAADDAPHAVLLSVFWLTRWGVSMVHCQAHNDALLQAAIADNAAHQLKELEARRAAEVAELSAKLERMGRLGDFGAANDPLPQVRRTVPALPVIAVPGEPCRPASATTIQPMKTAR